MEFSGGMDMSIQHETLYGYINHLTVNKGGRDKFRTKPVTNGIGMSEEEYEDYWSKVTNIVALGKEGVNLIAMEQGIPLPYWSLESLSRARFADHAVLVVLSLFYNRNM